MKYINRFLFLLLLLLQVNFFDLFSLGDQFMRLNDYTNKLLSLLIIILMLIVNLIFTNKVVVKNTGFGFPIFITIVGFVLVYIGSAYAYSESFTSIFKVSYYYLILLLFFALLNSQKSARI